MSERIVAVGLLTARDLETLGTGFRRMFPVAPDASFDDLLLAIDEAVERKDAGRHPIEMNAPARDLGTR